jgi:glycosyltransferase involved in cell wall biosynthesis
MRTQLTRLIKKAQSRTARVEPYVSMAADRPLELGCGAKKIRPDAIGVDKLRLPGVDVHGPVPAVLSALDAGSVDVIFSEHFLEHVSDLDELVGECARLLRFGGILIAIVPHFSNPFFYSDPTHRTPFGLYTLSYYAFDLVHRRSVPRYVDSEDCVAFRITSVDLLFQRSLRRPISMLVGLFLESACHRSLRSTNSDSHGSSPVQRSGTSLNGSSRIRVCSLTGTSNEPSSRFRVRQFIAPLRSYGIDIEDLPSAVGRYPPECPGQRPLWFGRAVSSAYGRARRSRKFGLALLQREFLSTIATVEIACKRPRVLDVDDAVHLSQRLGSINYIARRCETIICGNSWLAEQFSWHPDVVVVPTAVDMERYSTRVHREAESVTIGWMGTSSNIHELDRIAPAIEVVLRLRKSVRMVVVCDRPNSWRLAGHAKVEGCSWSALTEIADLQRIDIGVMPLADSPWARGKCGFKLLTYLSCGVAAIGSPVGVNPGILGNDSWLLPSSETEWVDAILRLVDDASARKECASAGRQRVEEFFSVTALTPVLAAALRRVHDAQG